MHMTHSDDSGQASFGTVMDLTGKEIVTCGAIADSRNLIMELQLEFTDGSTLNVRVMREEYMNVILTTDSGQVTLEVTDE